MAQPLAPALEMSDEQRLALQELAARSKPHRIVVQARALLRASQGMANTRIARELGVSRSTVIAWRERFAAEGLEGVGKVRPGRGRKPSIPKEKVEAIVHDTLHTKPEGETHWSTRSMARAQDVSSATVQRIWSARGIKPHLVDTFKLSNDKHFEEKLIDVVGLYLNPPDKAVVLCMDEK
ncbi:MAG: IS630 family transposase, partial [Acidimicrobiia bacterium]